MKNRENMRIIYKPAIKMNRIVVKLENTLLQEKKLQREESKTNKR